MHVTPLDLRQQHFRTAMRGFDKTEVIAFLAEAADDYEAALLEADRLRQDVSRLAAQLAEHQQHERDLRNTLLTAQRLADEIKDNAQRQAATVVKEAESKAGIILDKAQARVEDVQREIDGLRLKRRDAEVAVESVIGNLRNTLDFIREQDDRDKSVEKVVPHRPRLTDTREPQGWAQTRAADADDEPAAVAR